MERAERAGEALGSPPSSRRGGGVDFGGRAGVLRRDDGMPLNFDRPGADPAAGAFAGSPPRGYASLEEETPGGQRGRDPADDRHAADLLAAQRASAEEAARARAAAESASLAATDMSSPEAVAKLKHDLAVAGETVESLRTALAAIDVERDPGAAAAGPVARLAEQCRQMKPRVVALVESATDEGLLMAALALHDELGDVLDRRDAIAAAAAAEPEMRAALAASLAEEAARLALREGEERAPAAEKATDALVDLFGAPSSSQLPPAPTVDASLVDLLSPAETGASGRGSGSPAAEKGKAAATVSDPFAGNPFAAPATPAAPRDASPTRSRRPQPPARRAPEPRIPRDSTHTIRSRRRRRRDLRRPAPETRTHSRCATRSRRRRALRGRPTRSRRRAPAGGLGRSPRRLPGPRARRARYRTRSSTRGTVRRARRWSEVRVRRAAAPRTRRRRPSRLGRRRTATRSPRWRRRRARRRRTRSRPPGSETRSELPRHRASMEPSESRRMYHRGV